MSLNQLGSFFGFTRTPFRRDLAPSIEARLRLTRPRFVRIVIRESLGRAAGGRSPTSGRQRSTRRRGYGNDVALLRRVERGVRPVWAAAALPQRDPLTSRRYDHLWRRVGEHLPWAAAQQISTHWLRHTTLTWVERHLGHAVARAYAGHNDRSDFGATATYVRADLYEIAVALAALTGEDHPLLESRSVESTVAAPSRSPGTSGNTSVAVRPVQ